MTNIDAYPPGGVPDTPTQDDREQALTLWRALLPTWTQPAAARFRNPGPLSTALRNPTACVLVADRLDARRALVGVRDD